MHYYLYAQIPGFYVREWERRDPIRSADPLAIHRDKLVIDVNDASDRAGLREGMGVDEAKVLLQGKGLVAWEEEPYRDAQKRWLDVLAEYSHRIEPDRQDSAWVDLHGHPDVFEIVSSLRIAIHSEIGLNAILGLASTKWLAKLAATHFGDLPIAAWEIAMRECMEDAAGFLSSMPIVCLTPVDASHRERLKFLGYRTIGDVAGVGVRTMRGQFGDAASTILAAAKGGIHEPVRPLYPAACVSAHIRFEGGVNDSEEIARGLGELAKRIGQALCDREAQGASIELKVEFEDGDETRKRTFSRAIRTSREALSALKLTLSELDRPVYGLRATMSNLKKVREHQANLYAARLPGDDLAAGKAIEGVRKVFGDRSVILASEKDEPRRVRVLRAWSYATGWR